MQHGFEETEENEVKYVGREVCLERKLDASASEISLRGSQGEDRHVDVEGSWRNSGTGACNFLSKITSAGWGWLGTPEGPEDLEQLLEELIQRVQNISKETGKLQISTVFLENSLTPCNKRHKSVSSLWPNNPSSGNIYHGNNWKGNRSYL